jgi:hypothetical protein
LALNRPGLIAAGTVLLGVAAAVCGFAQAVPSRHAIEPSKASVEARSQQLEFTIVLPGRKAIGARVFLNPGADQKLTAASEAYVGEVYFPDHPGGPTSRFVLPLKRLISGKSEMVLVPITSDHWSGRPVVIRIIAGSIEKPDNGAFQ